MPIVVQHQPPYSRLGQLAYRTGQLQYSDRRRREEEARLMQERQMAQQQAMQDQRLAVDVWGRQYGQMGALQRMAIGNQQQQERDQQQQQFGLDRLDVSHQNALKIGEIQNNFTTERDTEIEQRRIESEKRALDSTLSLRDDAYARELERLTFADELNTGQYEQQLRARTTADRHQKRTSGMNSASAQEYRDTVKQESDIAAGMRSGKIQEEQGKQQIQQIRQERIAISTRAESYLGGSAPGETVPYQAYPGWNRTLMNDNSVSSSPDLSPFQRLPVEQQMAAWEKAGTYVDTLPDGSRKHYKPIGTEAGEYEVTDLKSEEVLSRERRSEAVQNAKSMMGAIQSHLDGISEDRSAVYEEYDEGPVKEAMLRNLGEQTVIYKRMHTEYLQSILQAEVGQAGGAEGPLPGEPAPRFTGVMEGMPVPEFVPEGEGAPVGLVGRDGQIVPPDEAFAGPVAGRIGSAVVNPNAPLGTEENPVMAPTAMDAVRHPVGTWFQTPRGVVDMVTIEHKRRAGLSVAGIQAGGDAGRRAGSAAAGGF